MNNHSQNLELFGQSSLADSTTQFSNSLSGFTSDLTSLEASHSLTLATSHLDSLEAELATTDGLDTEILDGDFWDSNGSFATLMANAALVSDSQPNSNAKPDAVIGLSANQALTATTTARVDPLVAPQNNTLSTAQNLGTLVGARAFSGRVSASDTWDIFQFQLDTRSDVNLMLSGMTANADLYLMWDANNNGAIESGEILDRSWEPGTSVEAITFNNLLQGNYYVGVNQYSGSTNYSLFAAASPDGGLHHEAGSLRADGFSLSNHAYSIFSGNGNVDFGQGFSDSLDLSAFSVNDVVNWNPVTANGGGVIYNDGNSTRVFDAMSLSSGHQILMEGLDGIWFQEGYYSFNSDVLPNDPLFDQQWNLHMMGVHNAWRFTQGSDDVLIGVQDSGLGINNNGQLHPDFDGARTFGYGTNMDDDFFGDNSSHGTAVQGIIAAAGNNGIGMAGINWNSDVAHIDVFGPDSFDLDEATSLMADYANSTGRRLVVNMSLGAHGAGVGNMPVLEQLIAQNADNALFVISSGNDDDGFTSYPALLSQAYDNVMAVGASWGNQDWYGNVTEPGDRISYPGWWGSNYGYGLSLMGPSEVITTRAFDSGWSTGFNYYQNADASFGPSPFNGTSAAAPNVAGVASLVWSANPNLSAGEVHQIMQETAVDLGFPGYDYEYGSGFVNADAAVRRAMALRRSFQPGSAASDAVAAAVLPETAMSVEWGFAPLTQATESVAFTASNLVSDDSLAVGSIVQADEPAAVLEAVAIALDGIELPTVQNGTLGAGALARGGADGVMIAPEAGALPQLATAELAAEAGVETLRLERSWALTAEADLLAANLVQPLGQVLAAEVDALTGELVAAV